MHAQGEGIHTTDTSRNSFHLPVLCPPCLHPYVYISWLFYLNPWSLTTIHTRTEVFNVIFSDQETPNREFLHILDTHVPVTVDLQDYARSSVNQSVKRNHLASSPGAIRYHTMLRPILKSWKHKKVGTPAKKVLVLRALYSTQVFFSATWTC